MAHDTRPSRKVQPFCRLNYRLVSKTVVVDYLGGVVVGRIAERDRCDGGKDSLWVPLERFPDLDAKTLCHKLKVMVFLPPDWNSRRRDLFERSTRYRLTESVVEAQSVAAGNHVVRAVQASAGQLPGPENGWRGQPLPYRIDAVLRRRKLKRTDFASIFGVTPGAVTRWLCGLKAHEDLSKAKCIPDDLAALMVAWIESGKEPAPEQLASLPSRQRTPRGGPRRAQAFDRAVRDHLGF
jgi:hypothetical protein